MYAPLQAVATGPRPVWQLAWFVISLPIVKWAEEDENHPFAARHPQS
jgi:hypothetical protein